MASYLYVTRRPVKFDERYDKASLSTAPLTLSRIQLTCFYTDTLPTHHLYTLTFLRIYGLLSISQKCEMNLLRDRLRRGLPGGGASEPLADFMIGFDKLLRRDNGHMTPDRSQASRSHVLLIASRYPIRGQTTFRH